MSQVEKDEKDAPFKVGVRVRPFTTTEVAENEADGNNKPLTGILKVEDNLVSF